MSEPKFSFQCTGGAFDMISVPVKLSFRRQFAHMGTSELTPGALKSVLQGASFIFHVPDGHTVSGIATNDVFVTSIERDAYQPMWD